MWARILHPDNWSQSDTDAIRGALTNDFQPHQVVVRSADLVTVSRRWTGSTRSRSFYHCLSAIQQGARCIIKNTRSCGGAERDHCICRGWVRGCRRRSDLSISVVERIRIRNRFG